MFRILVSRFLHRKKFFEILEKVLLTKKGSLKFKILEMTYFEIYVKKYLICVLEKQEAGYKLLLVPGVEVLVVKRSFIYSNT